VLTVEFTSSSSDLRQDVAHGDRIKESNKDKGSSFKVDAAVAFGDLLLGQAQAQWLKQRMWGFGWLLGRRRAAISNLLPVQSENAISFGGFKRWI